jgi:TRAP-type C4-dicarboxylate transport system permease small subunit
MGIVKEFYMEQDRMDANLEKAKTQPPPREALQKFIHFLDRIITRLSKYGSYVSAFFLAVMMFLTFFDVISNRLGKWTVINSRTDFFGPIIGGQELIELFMLITISFALSYCASKQGHIRVDLIMQYTSNKANRWFNVMAYGVSTIFCVLVTWQAFKYGLENIRDKSVSTILTLPLYPFNFIVFIGGAFITLVLLRDFFKSIEEAKG